MTLYTTTSNGIPTGLAPEEFATVAILKAIEAGFTHIEWEAAK